MDWQTHWINYIISLQNLLLLAIFVQMELSVLSLHSVSPPITHSPKLLYYNTVRNYWSLNLWSWEWSVICVFEENFQFIPYLCFSLESYKGTRSSLQVGVEVFNLNTSTWSRSHYDYSPWGTFSPPSSTELLFKIFISCWVVV